jgi:hypothetical protein
MTATTVLIPSATTTDAYPISLIDGRATGCTCLGRTYRPHTTCRHMRAAEAQAAEERRTARLEVAKTALAATGPSDREARKALRLLDRPTITPAELASRDRFWDPLSYIDED